MKRIIVPINFSGVSLDALEFALSVANKMNYHLRLLSVVNSGGSFFFWRSPKTNDEAEIKAKLDDSIAKYKDLYTVEGGTLDYEIIQGSTVRTLIKATAAQDAKTYAVIVGINSEEETNKETFSIITEMTVPVITWRKGFEHKPVKSILMPVGTKHSSRQKVPFVTGFARTMGAKIEVLGCADSDDLPSVKNMITTHVQQAVDFIRQNDVECEAHYQFGKGVGSSIIEYSNKLKTDMISSMTDISEDPMEMFTSTDTEYILNHSKQPVICIHPV
ncbi:MAG: universal stress protein [Prevotellaceae bacterium]|jgi:nucleotide-binding universal stress UspA family protein|nr:universal stress protein [Prevotellaceae bacterium]